eukprot:5416148-Amphidinium_carterae.1
MNYDSVNQRAATEIDIGPLLCSDCFAYAQFTTTFSLDIFDGLPVGIKISEEMNLSAQAEVKANPSPSQASTGWRR